MPEPFEVNLPIDDSVSARFEKKGYFVVRGLCDDDTLITPCLDFTNEHLERTLATKYTLREYHDYFGAVADEDDSQACRWSLLLPLHPAVLNVIKSALTHLSPFFAKATSPEAVLCDLNCFISDKGSRMQTPHFDTAFDDDDALDPSRSPSRLVTVFVALQDVSASMGPTLLWESTHSKESHDALVEWQCDREYTSEGDADLSGLPFRKKSLVKCLLRKGDALVMDSRLVHAGSTNSCRRRALLTFSFCLPDRTIPGQTHCMARSYCDVFSLQAFRDDGTDPAGRKLLKKTSKKALADIAATQPIMASEESAVRSELCLEACTMTQSEDVPKKKRRKHVVDPV